jgi:hypothetical protein
MKLVSLRKEEKSMTTQTKRFSVSHTEPTNATAESVWALWSNVDNWPAWDEGLEDCKLEGSFAAGNDFSLTPTGGEPIRAQIVEVIPYRGFTDETRLPFGVLRAIHSFEEGNGGNSVTHRIEAEIDPEHADFFEKVIWAGMDVGLPQSVRNIAKLAEKRT